MLTENILYDADVVENVPSILPTPPPPQMTLSWKTSLRRVLLEQVFVKRQKIFLHDKIFSTEERHVHLIYIIIT